ncbi:MAG TPA: FAD-dependent oxidoreductase [Bacteroidales bacterium]|nr:FAD-dependent oxidoreductase [Bacteroidales bacterium]
METEIYDVIILGGGPAGLASGIYTSRAKLSTLILNEGAVGGQMVLTNEVANYPGVEKTTGYQLANIMKNQAREFGCKIKSNVRITGYSLNGPIKRITMADGQEFQALSVIMATGGSPRQLHVPGEDTFRGAGISFCATCDGEFFTGKEIMVVGGGNSALEEAVALTKYATKVTIIHQFGHFQAFEHAIEEAQANPKIEFVLNSVITEFIGKENLTAVTVKNLNTANISVLPTQGAFIFIGYLPNTESLKGLVALNEKNEIITSPGMETNIPGVFAAGDSIAKRYRQITTAVSDGTIAALSASEYLAKNKKKILMESQFEHLLT